MKSATVSAALLIEDMNLYPRGHVDEIHVGNLSRSLEAGAKFPPIIADRKTKQIIDGFHRRRAYMKLNGEAAKIPVEWRDYPNDATRLADAIKTNSGHGLRLNRQDEIRCILLGRQLGLQDADLALSLHISEERVQEIGVRVVVVDGEPEPAKKVAAHRYGEEVTRQEADAWKQFSGVSFLQHVNSLRKVIDRKGFDASRADVLDALWALVDSIKKNTPKAVATEA